MGVRLPVEMDPPRIGGSGLGGRGCASAGERGEKKHDGGGGETERQNRGWNATANSKK